MTQNPSFSPELVTQVAQYAVEHTTLPEDAPPLLQHRLREATAHNVAAFAPCFATVVIPAIRQQVLDEVAAALADVDLDAQMIVAQMRDAEGQ